MTTVEDTPVRGAVAARVVDLTKVYGSGNAEVRALDGVTLDIATGEFTAVMGPVRIRQVHADALLCGPGQPHLRGDLAR